MVLAVKKAPPAVGRYVPIVFLAFGGTMSVFSAVGVFTETTVEGRVDRLIWGIAASLALWMTLIVSIIDHYQNERRGYGADASILEIPRLQAHRTTAEEWTQPVKGEGDQLVEGTQLDADGEWNPIVLLVRANGEIHGYSRPIDGAGLNFTLTAGGPDMPPDPA